MISTQLLIMEEEYYKEPNRWSFPVLMIVMTLIPASLICAITFGTILMTEAGVHSLGITTIPSKISEANQNLIAFTLVTCGALIITGFIGAYLSLRNHTRISLIPLTMEKVIIESRSIDGGYNVISGSGIAYRVLDEKAFSHLKPGSTIEAMVKYYPKDNDGRLPLIVRVIT